MLFPSVFSAVTKSAFPGAVPLAALSDAIFHSFHTAHGAPPHKTETSRYESPAVATGSSTVRVIETIIPKGDDEPAQVIMRHASERGCDLIVMASHGRSDVAQFFLGRSVAEQVARDSRIPTVIARLYGPRRTTRPIDRFKTVLYVTDLAEHSKHILPVVSSITRRTKAKLEALCVFNEGDEEPADGGQATLEKFFAEADASDSLSRIRRLHVGMAEAGDEYAGRHKAELVPITAELA